MPDPFVSQDTDVFSSGEGTTQTGEAPPSAIVDSNATPPLETPTDNAATGIDQGVSGGDGTGQASSGVIPTDGQQQTSGAQEQSAMTAEDVGKLEQEAEAALADERTPKWFKNVISNVYKPKLDNLGKELGQFSALGKPEEVEKAVQLASALREVRSDPRTGMPVHTTENFVKNLYESDPQITYQLISDLATLPSPITQGLTVTQELLKTVGIDPNRLEDVKKFAANGYSLTTSAYGAPEPEDLAQIPEKYQATFAKLDPDTRSSLLSDTDTVRDYNLESHRIRMEQEEANKTVEERQAAEETQRVEQQQAEFKAAVDQKGTENFIGTTESVMNTFVDSLAKQAGLSKLDSMMVANTVVNAMEPTLAGRMSLEALKADEIEIDPQAPQIINKLEELSKHAAYYQLTNDQSSLAAVAGQINELKEKLIAKSNKIIAALAGKRNASAVAPNEQLNGMLSANGNNRHAMTTHAVPGGLPPSAQQGNDFSEESYESAMAQDPHFRR